MAGDTGSSSTVDVVIVGGGHNSLVAAAYLARAGLSVCLLERSARLGGAAVSVRAFPGVDVRLSRYSYLVSLLPKRITSDLGIPITLASRRFSSYTPDPGTHGRTGLLIGPRSDFRAIGAAGDAAGVADFYRRCQLITGRVWPTLIEPLPTRSELRRLVVDGLGNADSADTWRELFDEPIGRAICRAVDNDLVRGLIGTDALIGTFASLDDESLSQNICFLYHVVGGGDGQWRVPVGGMGAVTEALAGAARRYGARLLTGADAESVEPDGLVRYRSDGTQRSIHGRFVLAGVTPVVLARLLGEPAPVTAEGAQVKINMVLRRLPRLRDPRVSPEQAFTGTFHANETWRQLEAAQRRAAAGVVPAPLPCEAYCHSLTDPGIMSAELRAAGAHTMTVFGLHTPHGLRATSATLSTAVVASLNSLLAEPIDELLMNDGNGQPCVETTTTADLDTDLGMTAGNIFHGALKWPFAEDDEPLDSPARRWGVATAHPRVMLCGSGARRGGAVSGLGGHNAAMAVLASLGRQSN